MGYEPGYGHGSYVTERIATLKSECRPNAVRITRKDRLLGDGEVDCGPTFNAMRNVQKLRREKLHAAARAQMNANPPWGLLSNAIRQGQGSIWESMHNVR